MAQAAHLQNIHEKDLRDVVLVRTSAGACLRGHFRENGRKVAVKFVKDSKWIDRLKNAGILVQVCSSQVGLLVPLGVYTTHSLVGLVWDWMTEGSLDSLIHETDLFPELSVALCLQILLDVAEGLSHLHAISLPHGALKATNVLLDQEYHAKLCDWGQEMHLTTLNGRGPCYRDLAYMSPEVLQGAVSSVEADIYSFGVLLWETLNRKRPCEVIDQLQTKLEFGLGVDLLPPMTPQNQVLTQLIIRCLSSEPQKRPSAKECAVVLRTTLAAFEPHTFTKAVLYLKTCKERRLQSCKMPSFWELPIELHNLEQDNSCKATTKHWPSKVIPQTETLPVSSMNASRTASLPIATRGYPLTQCCRDTGKSSVQSTSSSSDHGFTQMNGCHGVQRQNSASLRSPSASPTMLFQSPSQHNTGNQVKCQMSAGRSCCQLLQERREAIVRFMTEGRLNNLLDVLRSRHAVTRETYEIITAALTLSARTRCLLDVCACLDENVALLVATTLGLVSIENAQIVNRWQAG